jgi:hypothetical protein
MVTIEYYLIYCTYCFDLVDQGVAYSWGKGNTACLGHGDHATQFTPARIDAFIGYLVTDITAGPTRAAVLCKSYPSSESATA